MFKNIGILILVAFSITACGGGGGGAGTALPIQPSAPTDPADTAIYGNWEDWVVEPASLTQQNTTRTRIRFCGITIHGNTDIPAPTCDGPSSETETVANPNFGNFTVGNVSTTVPDLTADLSATFSGLTSDESIIRNNIVGDIEQSNVLQTVDDLQGDWITDEVKSAWADGWTGKGINIAIADGFTASDNDVITFDSGERSLISGGTYTLTGTQTLTHGDLVSSIAGGSNSWEQTLTISSPEHGTATYTRNLNNIYGIAAEADITKYDVLSNQSNIGANPNGVAIDLSTHDILNLSLGDATPLTADNAGDESTFWKGSLSGSNLTDSANGTLVVKAAGNDSLVSQRDSVNNALLGSDLSDSTLIVGALNGAGTTIATYSNTAGSLSNDFVVDIGVASGAQGTSFAAPRVAGKAAIVMQKFDSLNASEVADLIKLTADDLGVTGVDNIYGHGKVNLTKALSPVGNLG